MLEIILSLLPKVPSVVAALPEFAKLIDQVGDMIGEDDQATLKDAYALAVQGSDAANAELAALVASKTGA